MAKENKNNKKEGKERKSGFFKASRAELKKVTWPTAKQLIQKTSIVLVLVLVISFIVFVLDFVFGRGYEFIMDKANKGNTVQVVTENTVENEVEVTSEDVSTEGIDLTTTTTNPEE